MKKFIVDILLDNDAWVHENGTVNAQAIINELESIRHRMIMGDRSDVVRDVNGNRCGYFGIDYGRKPKNG
jgi:hypothetical protein